MTRRGFITLLGGAAAWPLAARAQQPAKMPIIACLVGGSKAATERYFGGFSQGMRESGYTQDRDYGFEVRYAEGDYAHSPLLAEEADISPKKAASRFDPEQTVGRPKS